MPPLPFDCYSQRNAPLKTILIVHKLNDLRETGFLGVHFVGLHLKANVTTCG